MEKYMGGLGYIPSKMALDSTERYQSLFCGSTRPLAKSSPLRGRFRRK